MYISWKHKISSCKICWKNPVWTLSCQPFLSIAGSSDPGKQEFKVEGSNIPGYHGHCHFSLASPVLLISVNLPKHCLVVISKDFHLAVGLLSPDQFIDAKAERQRAFVKHVKWVVSCWWVTEAVLQRSPRYELLAVDNIMCFSSLSTPKCCAANKFCFCVSQSNTVAIIVICVLVSVISPTLSFLVVTMSTVCSILLCI